MGSKKDEERFWLNEVTAAYPAFPRGNAIDCESPDFLIQQTDKIIGVEITDYIREQRASGSPQRESEKLWSMVANKAQAEFEQTYDVPITLTFIGQLRKTLTFPIVQKLASETVQLVSQHIPDGLFENIVLTDEELEGTSLSEFVGHIHIMRVRNKDQALWTSGGGGWTDVAPNEIQSLISAKDAKVKDYLTKCAEVWLVIVADPRYISSNVTNLEELARHTFPCHFRHVLLYDGFTKKVFPLTTDMR